MNSPHGSQIPQHQQNWPPSGKSLGLQSVRGHMLFHSRLGWNSVHRTELTRWNVFKRENDQHKQEGSRLFPCFLYALFLPLGDCIQDPVSSMTNTLMTPQTSSLDHWSRPNHYPGCQTQTLNCLVNFSTWMYQRNMSTSKNDLTMFLIPQTHFLGFSVLVIGALIHPVTPIKTEDHPRCHFPTLPILLANNPINLPAGADLIQNTCQ